MKNSRYRKSVDNTMDPAKVKPDCSVCIHRTGCEQAREMSFCTRFQSSEPERYEDPNDAWVKGEDYPPDYVG